MIHGFHMFKRMGFSIKQFFILFLLALILITYLQILGLQRLKQDQFSDISGRVSSNMEQANIFINNYIDGVKSLLLVISTRNDIFDIPEQEAVKSLSLIARNYPSISTLFIKRENGSITCNRQIIYEIFGKDQINEMIESTETLTNMVNHSEPYFSSMIAEQTACFTLSLADKNRAIAAEINLNYLYNYLLQIFDDRKYMFFVTTDSGHVLLFDRGTSPIPLKKRVYPLEIAKEYEKLIFRNYEMDTLHKINDPGDVYLIRSQNNKVRWKINVILDGSIFTESIANAYSDFYIVTFLWIIILGIVLFIVSFLFTKPIRNLAYTMDKVDRFENLTAIRTNREDEIGRLTKSYNKLVRTIHKLLNDVMIAEREKNQYELKMLQSQIGPHFLYNTLACIASLIRQDHSDQAEEAIRALIDLLPFGFHRTDEMVSLKEETERLYSYIRIQKTRYGDVFYFGMTIQDGLENCTLPKLTLQPLVENAIFHGIIPKAGGHKKILIQACRRKDSIIICVYDNGVGISRDRYDEILTGRDKKKINDRFSCIGLSNVNERIRLTYGEEYGITIHSRVGVCTAMCIRIPYHDTEKM